MSWFREEFRRRRAGCFVNVAGGSTKDADLVIPYDWDEFWAAIDSSGLELRVTGPDGFTLLKYSVDDGSGGAFNRATRSARIRIDGMTVPGTTNECVLFWVYFDSSSTQGTAAQVTSISAAETAYLELSGPSTYAAVAQPPRPGLDKPRVTFGKGSADASFLYFDLTDLLEKRTTTFARRRHLEEPLAATYVVNDDTGTPQAGLIDTALTRFVEVRTGTGGRQIWLKVRIKAGTADAQYTAVATILTAVPQESGTHRTLTARAGFRIRDVLET